MRFIRDAFRVCGSDGLFVESMVQPTDGKRKQDRAACARIARPVQQGKRPSLCADFSWTFVGNAIYAGGQFAMLMLLAKLVPLELVGQYALSLAIVYPVMMLTNLQLRSVMTSGVRQQAHFGHYLSLRLLTTSLALAIIFAITQVLGYRWEMTVVAMMVGIAYAIETVSDVYYARLQLNDRMAEISKSLMAFCTTDDSIFPSRNNSYSVVSVINRASTSKKSRREARFSLRPKPSVPREARRRGVHRLIRFGSALR